MIYSESSPHPKPQLIFFSPPVTDWLSDLCLIADSISYSLKNPIDKSYSFSYPTPLSTNASYLLIISLFSIETSSSPSVSIITIKDPCYSGDRGWSKVRVEIFFKNLLWPSSYEVLISIWYMLFSISIEFLFGSFGLRFTISYHHHFCLKLSNVLISSPSLSIQVYSFSLSNPISALEELEMSSSLTLAKQSYSPPTPSVKQP